MKFDADRVIQLLNIVEKTTTVAPGYNHLIGEAMAELRQINEDVRKANEVKQGKPVTPAQYGDVNSPRQTTTEYSAREPGSPVIAGRSGYVPGVTEARNDADVPSSEQPSLLDRRT